MSTEAQKQHFFGMYSPLRRRAVDGFHFYIYPDKTFYIEQYSDMKGKWKYFSKGSFEIENTLIKLKHPNSKNYLRESYSSYHIKYIESQIFLVPDTELISFENFISESKDYSNIYSLLSIRILAKEPIPFAASCIDSSQYQSALTTGKIYWVTAYNDEKQIYSVKNDNQQLKWYPEQCFSRN